ISSSEQEETERPGLGFTTGSRLRNRETWARFSFTTGSLELRNQGTWAQDFTTGSRLAPEPGAPGLKIQFHHRISSSEPEAPGKQRFQFHHRIVFGTRHLDSRLVSPQDLVFGTRAPWTQDSSF
ncbi:hypothetical protein AVEN_269912-1, partial [Araneus ventricosus]